MKSYASTRKTTTSQDSSGGRGPEIDPPAAEVPANVAGGSLPLDHPSLKSCTNVTLILKDGKEIRAFRDPQYGWMDMRGVSLPATPAPVAWRPL